MTGKKKMVGDVPFVAIPHGDARHSCGACGCLVIMHGSDGCAHVYPPGDRYAGERCPCDVRPLAWDAPKRGRRAA